MLDESKSTFCSGVTKVKTSLVAQWSRIHLQFRRHRRCGFYPWVRKILWRRKWQPTPVFLLGESHRQGSLAGYSPWGRKESDMTEYPTCTSSHSRHCSKVYSCENNRQGLSSLWDLHSRRGSQTENEISRIHSKLEGHLCGEQGQS